MNDDLIIVHPTWGVLTLQPDPFGQPTWLADRAHAARFASLAEAERIASHWKAGTLSIEPAPPKP